MATVVVVAAISAIAAAIALSPVTVLAAAALALITSAICRGVSGTERRALLWMFAVAITLRVAAIAVLFLWSDPNHLSSFPFDGDGIGVKLRSLWIRNVWLGIPIDQSQFAEAFGDYAWTSYLYVLAYVQYLLGPAPYAVHLLSVCWTMAAAALLYRLVRRSYGLVPALVALALILFLPTLFMWSVAAIKDAWYLLLMVLVLVGVERVVRGRGWAARGAWAMGVAATALVLHTTREGALAMVAGTLLMTAFATLASRRAWAVAASVVLLPVVLAVLLYQPSVQALVMARMRASAQVHIGHVLTEGYAYKLLDQRLYSGDAFQSMTWDEGQRYAARAVSSFFLVPLPWQAVSRSQLLFIPQQILWYVLLLLAVAGAVNGCRRDVFVTWLFISVIGVGAAVIAPHEGNMGTLVRHRDGVVPFVVCLSAIAAASVLSSIGGATAYMIESSVVLQRAWQLGRVAAFASSARIRSAWRESALAWAVDDLRAAPGWRRLRWLGAALLTGSALTITLGPAGSLAWPPLLMWTSMAASGLLMIVYARGLVRAWRGRQDTLVAADAAAVMTV